MEFKHGRFAVKQLFYMLWYPRFFPTWGILLQIYPFPISSLFLPTAPRVWNQLVKTWIWIRRACDFITRTAQSINRPQRARVENEGTHERKEKLEWKEALEAWYSDPNRNEETPVLPLLNPSWRLDIVYNALISFHSRRIRSRKSAQSPSFRSPLRFWWPIGWKRRPARVAHSESFASKSSAYPSTDSKVVLTYWSKRRRLLLQSS